MFDSNVANEGLGRAEVAMRESRTDGIGAGPSPDGLGAYVDAQPGDRYAQPPMYPQQQMAPMPQMPYGQPMAGEMEFLEPVDTSQGAALKSSGFTLLFVAVSTGIGYAWKGGHGAIAGLFLSAGAANGYRAQKWFNSDDPSEKHEAIVSSIFSAAEVFGGLYVGYHAAKRSEKKRE